jgi:hypothetical protein
LLGKQGFVKCRRLSAEDLQCPITPYPNVESLAKVVISTVDSHCDFSFIHSGTYGSVEPPPAIRLVSHEARPQSAFAKVTE